MERLWEPPNCFRWEEIPSGDLIIADFDLGANSQNETQNLILFLE